MTSNLSGMTGFARHTGEASGITYVWEIRSVNGKSLDMRLRVPSEFSALEIPVRKAVSQVLKRGNLQMSLTFQMQDQGMTYRINEPFLKTLKTRLERAGAQTDLVRLLQVTGVVEEIELSRETSENDDVETAMFKTFTTALEALVSARRAEGAAMGEVLENALSQIENLTERAAALASYQPKAIRDRFKSRLDVLMQDELPEDRLVQEAALLAMKADVQEELDRLNAHCVEGRKLLKGGSPVGRKLDFLAQEFNRETNTLCSKSADIDLTKIGMELKSVVEQFREQAANVE